jgi:uncharacterized cupredoxin-like copper-binding protein
MRGRLLTGPVTVLMGTAFVVMSTGGPAFAARATTTVTIQAEGTDLSGTVSSPKPATCADGRKVIVFRQIGTRGGGDDEKLASDTAEKQGDVYRWSTGNTGQSGKFYAKVRRTPDCKPDTSPTITVDKPE